MDEDDLAPDPALAAAMGFSTFGAEGPSKKKKRKFDAVVAMPSAPASSSGTGANRTPVGARIPIGTRGATDGSDDQPDAASAAATHSAQTASTMTMAPPPVDPTGSGEAYPAHGARSDKLPTGEWDFQALFKGVPTANGDMAYYAHSFVEDPWAHLEDGEGGGE